MEKRNYIRPTTTYYNISIESFIAGSKPGTGSGIVSTTCGWEDAESVIMIGGNNYTPLQIWNYIENNGEGPYCADGDATIICDGKTFTIDCDYRYYIKNHEIVTDEDGTVHYYFKITGTGESGCKPAFIDCNSSNM